MARTCLWVQNDPMRWHGPSLDKATAAVERALQNWQQLQTDRQQQAQSGSSAQARKHRA